MPVQRLRYAMRHARWTRARSVGAWLRLVWHDFVVHALLNRGGERCQTCGHGYHGISWMAPDNMYVQVHGSGGGTLCPSCFSKEARPRRVIWVPFVWNDGADIKGRINASSAWNQAMDASEGRRQ